MLLLTCYRGADMPTCSRLDAGLMLAAIACVATMLTWCPLLGYAIARVCETFVVLAACAWPSGGVVCAAARVCVCVGVSACWVCVCERQVVVVCLGEVCAARESERDRESKREREAYGRVARRPGCGIRATSRVWDAAARATPRAAARGPRPMCTWCAHHNAERCERSQWYGTRPSTCRQSAVYS